MTNKEKYRRAFGVLHASEDILTEVTHMETKKHFSLRKAVLLCAAVIAVFAMAGVCYAEDVGGIQRTIQLWCYGDQTDAVLEIQDGSYGADLRSCRRGTQRRGRRCSHRRLWPGAPSDGGRASGRPSGQNRCDLPGGRNGVGLLQRSEYGHHRSL